MAIVISFLITSLIIGLMFFLTDTETVGNIKNVCRACSENSSKASSPLLDAMFFTPSSTQALYNLEVRRFHVSVFQLPLCLPAYTVSVCFSVSLPACLIGLSHRSPAHYSTVAHL